MSDTRKLRLYAVGTAEHYGFLCTIDEVTGELDSITILKDEKHYKNISMLQLAMQEILVKRMHTINH